MRVGVPVTLQGALLPPGPHRVGPGPQGGRGSAVAPLPALDVPHEVDDDLALLGIIPGGKWDFWFNVEFLSQ